MNTILRKMSLKSCLILKMQCVCVCDLWPLQTSCRTRWWRSRHLWSSAPEWQFDLHPCSFDGQEPAALCENHADHTLGTRTENEGHLDKVLPSTHSSKLLFHSIHQSINLPTYQSINLSMHPSNHPSISRSFYPYIHPSDTTSIFLFVIKHSYGVIQRFRNPLHHRTGDPAPWWSPNVLWGPPKYTLHCFKYFVTTTLTLILTLNDHHDA